MATYNIPTVDQLKAMPTEERNKYFVWMNNAGYWGPNGGGIEYIVNDANTGDWTEVARKWNNFVSEYVNKPLAKAEEYAQRVKEYAASGMSMPTWEKTAREALAGMSRVTQSAPSGTNLSSLPTYEQILAGVSSANPYSKEGVVGSKEYAAMGSNTGTPAVTEPMVGMSNASTGVTQFVPQSQVASYKTQGWSEVPGVTPQAPPASGTQLSASGTGAITPPAPGAGAATPPASGTPAPTGGEKKIYQDGNKLYAYDGVNTPVPILSEEDLKKKITEGYNDFNPKTDTNPSGARPALSSIKPPTSTSATGSVPPAGSSGSSSTVLASRYGLANDEDANYKSSLALDGFLTILGVKNTTSLSPLTLAKVKGDPALMGKYILALGYGEYSLEDIYKDIKRMDMADAGDQSMASMTVIDGTKKKDDYAATTAGKTALSSPYLKLPPDLKGVSDQSLYKTKLFNMPDWGFKELAPLIDIESPEFKAEVEKIKLVYNDILMAQSSATTVREKAIADNAYEQLKKNVLENYNLKLSDNSIAAGAQIDTIGQNMANQGLTNTGIANEAVDDYLRTVRENDRRARKTNVETGDQNLMTKLTTSGSSSEIQALINEDQAKGLPREQWRAVKWGLVPSQDALDSFDVNKLMAEYKIDQAEAQKYHDSMIDENGNYRSTLYALKMKELQTHEANKTAAQQQKVMDTSIQAAKDKTFNWTTAATSGENQFGVPNTPAGAETGTETAGDQAQKYIDAAEKANPQTQTGMGTQVPPASGASLPSGTAAAKNFYRVGTDIFESGTNRRIGPTEWAASWSGKAKEDQASAPKVAPTPPPPVAKTLDTTAAKKAAGSMGTGLVSTPTSASTTQKSPITVPRGYKGTLAEWTTTDQQLNAAARKTAQNAEDKANIAFATNTYGWKATSI